jgi:hypothetical protein
LCLRRFAVARRHERRVHLGARRRRAAKDARLDAGTRPLGDETGGRERRPRRRRGSGDADIGQHGDVVDDVRLNRGADALLRIGRTDGDDGSGRD